MILELHIHSRFSYDSLLSPERIVKVAMDKGLNGIAVTDHDTIEGGVRAQAANKDSDFAVIVGSEVKTDAGDLIGLFLNEEIKSRDCLEAIDEIRGQGGIVVLPHPFRGHKLRDEIISAVDAIEVFNSRTQMPENMKAEELAKKYGKTPVAGSDAHFSLEIGLGRTSVGCCDAEDIRHSMLRGDTAAFKCLPSYAYLKSSSQLIKAIRTRRYTAAPGLLARAFADYILRS